MYRIVITNYYDKDKIVESVAEVNALISHLAHINRAFDIYKDGILIATGDKYGVKKLKSKKPITGKVRYCG